LCVFSVMFSWNAQADIDGIVPDPQARSATKWAVIVGVGEYTDPGLGSLPNAVNDANAVYNSLLQNDSGYTEENSILLASGMPPQFTPSRSNIMRFVNSYFSESGPNDSILFYFAGHGVTGPNEQTGESQLYLMPSDASLTSVSFTGFAFAAIEEAIQQAPAKSKVVIIDACHSGTGRSSNVLSAEAQDELEGASEGMVVLASCRADQLSHEMPGEKHGAFTFFLLDALEGRPEVDTDSNGLISAYEMNRYTREKTSAWARRQGFNQTPWHREEGSGEIYLAKAYDGIRKRISAPSSPAFRTAPSRPAVDLIQSIDPPPEPTALTQNGGQTAGQTQIFSGIEFVWIPRGRFEMGTAGGPNVSSGDEIQHWVSISQGFWMSRYEVTQEQMRQVAPNRAFYFEGKGLPADQVSWTEAVEFIRAVNGHGEEMFRLPTEAEWEYACRSGSSGPYSFGGDASGISNAAWYNGTQTQAVGRKQANAWGLHDMYGNVWEWCSDWYGGYPRSTVADSPGPDSGTHKVLRGGSFSSPAEETRSAFRRSEPPDFQNYQVGFRLVRGVTHDHALELAKAASSATKTLTAQYAESIRQERAETARQEAEVARQATARQEAEAARKRALTEASPRLSTPGNEPDPLDPDRAVLSSVENEAPLAVKQPSVEQPLPFRQDEVSIEQGEHSEIPVYMEDKVGLRLDIDSIKIEGGFGWMFDVSISRKPGHLTLRAKSGNAEAGSYVLAVRGPQGASSIPIRVQASETKPAPTADPGSWVSGRERVNLNISGEYYEGQRLVVDISTRATGRDYRWYMNGERLAERSGRLSYIFTQTGAFEVRVEEYDQGGKLVSSAMDNTTVLGHADLAYRVRSKVAAPFVGLPNFASYEWRVDGELVSTQQSISHTFPRAGTYRVECRHVESSTDPLLAYFRTVWVTTAD
jgi:formylglycine-generating enzyme required for sulfatase activity